MEAQGPAPGISQPAPHRRPPWFAGTLGFGLLALAVAVGYYGVARRAPPLSGGVPDGPRATAAARTARGTAGRPGDPEAAHLRKAGALAHEFNELRGRAPRTLAELSAWACREGKALPDDFRSTRDGRPYEFLNHDLALAEHTGRNGRRFVYHPAMGVVELTEDVLKVLADSGVVNGRHGRAAPHGQAGNPCGHPPDGCDTSGPPH